MSLTAEETYLVLVYRTLPRRQQKQVDGALKSRTMAASKQFQEKFERFISISLTRRRNKS